MKKSFDVTTGQLFYAFVDRFQYPTAQPTIVSHALRKDLNMLRTIVFSIALSATSLCADTVEIETYRGPVDIPQDIGKIAVFDLSAFDTLTALNVEVDGLVSPVYLPYLEQAAVGTTPVGSLFEPDYEAVFALQPDLIIAGGAHRSMWTNWRGLRPRRI
ncbi:hypothetical protein ACFQDZ_19060 [Sulfitobacter pacificus]|uniref:hypothetical protein n=1 Tax=Sulfitobacter pacificus TaxID=1499314 RepID=UPI003622C4FE